MPEIKHNFSGGKMEKDLDERLVPNGQYRDAMNIQVSTSEDSDVGTVQNILGNQLVLSPIGFENNEPVYLSVGAIVVGSVADEKVDTLYWLVYTPTADYIFSYKRKNGTSEIIFRDINKDVLKFDPRNTITGINVIDGMLFWTDNKTEPKKINIKRCKQGTPINSLDQTKLINEDQGVELPTNINIEEKHITVIKKTPTRALEMKLIGIRDPEKIYTGIIETTGDGFNFGQVTANEPHNIFDLSASNPAFGGVNNGITTGINAAGLEVPLGEVWHSKKYGFNLDGLTGWQDGSSIFQGNIPVGTKVVFAPFDENNEAPGLPITDYTIKGVVIDAYPGADARTSWKNGFRIKVTSVVGVPETPAPGQVLRYAIDLFNDNTSPALFEFKFPRFSYRYKFSDGEYSPFASFTRPAFIPGSFDFHPRKGYNLGMTNKISSIELGDFIYDEMPKDVVSVDILFKDEQSPNIYIVDTITPKDIDSTGTNIWNNIKSGGNYKIEKETINAVVPSNQLLRPWDNVPRKALAQDITGNRIVYGNYTQNYTLFTTRSDGSKRKFLPDFDLDWGTFPTELTGVGKSIKSLREYQLGVVFIDKYGRETPVMSNNKATINLPKNRSDKNNRLDVELLGNPPEELTHFKFFIKETAGEYYNMAMDRWYEAGDNNIWLAFASSDRNKVDIDTFLILKKGADSNSLVREKARYKILAIENEAPDFIKTSKNVLTSKTHISTKSLFTGITEELPLEANRQIKLRYEHYAGSSGQNLHELSKELSQLYIEFGKVGTPQLSQRYKILSITNDFTPGADSTADNAVAKDVAEYTIQLDKPLDKDVNFISDDPNGGNGSNIDDGAIVNIYEYKVENKPQFDGRFFVKIYYDEEFATNVANSSNNESKWKVRDVKKLFSMRNDHVDRHTTNTGWCLTRGIHNPGQRNTLKTPSYANGSLGGYYRGEESNNYGYYRVDTFSSFAMFFRRYMNDASADQFGQESNTHNIPLLIHLRPSPDGSGIYYPDHRDIAWKSQHDWHKEFGVIKSSPKQQTGNGSTTVDWFPWRIATKGISTPASHEKGTRNYLWSGKYSDTDGVLEDASAFPGRFGKGVTDLKKEKLARSAGLTANWESFQHRDSITWTYTAEIPISILGIWEVGSVDHSQDVTIDYEGGYPFFAESNHRGVAENAKDTEVWFIDNGPYVGQDRNSVDDLDYRNATATQSGGFVSSNRYGITTSGSSWSMDLGFGGIQSRSIKPDHSIDPDWWKGFWNIGDWNSLGNAVSREYKGGAIESFVNRLNFGQRFRFKEDPTQTIYTVGNVSGGAGTNNLYRHSNTVSAVTNQDWHAYFEPDALITHYSSSSFNFFGWWVVDSNQGAAHHEGTTTGNLSMAEEIGFNFTKNWRFSVTPALEWNPMANGKISSGIDVEIPVSDITGNTSGTGVTAAGGAGVGRNLRIFVTTLRGTNSGTSETSDNLIHRGMALYQYTKTSGSGTQANISNNLNYSGINEYFVIRNIVDLSASNGSPLFELWLGGYSHPFSLDEHQLATAAGMPSIGTNYRFVQVGMNGYSDNSEFNINTMAPLSNYQGDYGAIGAVGYNIEFVELDIEEDFLSENPAVWETEPKDIKDLDIYYEASPSFPIQLDESNLSHTIPISSLLSIGGGTYEVIGHNQDRLVFNSLDDNFLSSLITVDFNGVITTNIFSITLPSGFTFTTKMDVAWYESQVVLGYNILIGQELKLLTNTYNTIFSLGWHNCYSFGNGVESNRIRDSFNLPFIINGVKASTTLEQEYKEEHRKYGLIYSGIYNSTAGVNNLNQFIAAEKITKDINPIYGSIQKLHSRDSDLVTLCEDKILKILANKDAVFNADGNSQLTANENVLGQTVPFVGEYGISTNPESFASESYRAYFTDRVRGAVLRLSRDGLTPISNFGMNDWFKDNLKLSNKLIGSYDDNKEEYNLTLKNILYTEQSATIITSDGTSQTPVTKVEIQVVDPPGVAVTSGPQDINRPDPTTINQPSGGVGGSTGSSY